MPLRELNPEHQENSEDWEGNNAAFTCPVCNKVFIVSGLIHKGVRSCPSCAQATGHIEGGRMSGGRAFIEWA